MATERARSHFVHGEYDADLNRALNKSESIRYSSSTRELWYISTRARPYVHDLKVAIVQIEWQLWIVLQVAIYSSEL